MRIIRTLLGKSRREASACLDREKYREEQSIAMQAVHMKVAALATGADRIVRESRKTTEVAADLMARLRKDL